MCLSHIDYTPIGFLHLNSQMCLRRTCKHRCLCCLRQWYWTCQDTACTTYCRKALQYYCRCLPDTMCKHLGCYHSCICQPDKLCKTRPHPPQCIPRCICNRSSQYCPNLSSVWSDMVHRHSQRSPSTCRPSTEHTYSPAVNRCLDLLYLQYMLDNLMPIC